MCASELRKKAKAYDAKFDMCEVQGLSGGWVGGERCVWKKRGKYPIEEALTDFEKDCRVSSVLPKVFPTDDVTFWKKAMEMCNE